MRTFRVALLGRNEDRLSLLKSRVEATLAAEVVFRREALPVIAADPAIRHLHQARPDVVLVDVDSGDAEAGIAAIEALAGTVALFAVGALHQPQTIIRAMRAGASEFLDRDLTSGTLLEAFTRLHASLHGRKSDGFRRGKLITVASAKGGCGATTVAVNTAISLQKLSLPVALVDMAPLGHVSLHLNVRPQFALLDALKNLHRMDASLLEGFMTEVSGGLRLLAGLNSPEPLTAENSDIALLFDLLLDHYKYVVVDVSNRMDKISRTVCELSDLVLLVVQADVSSLWSAGRLREFLGGEPNSPKVQLLVNRYRKIAGFSDEDAQEGTQCRIFWKIPNQFNAVGPAIDRGSPVVSQNNSEIARSFTELAGALAALPPHGAAEVTDIRSKAKAQKPLERLIGLNPSPIRQT